MPRFGLPLALLLATVVTTVLAGGWAFSFTLLSILLAHEMGHYFAARRHGIETSLPHFIPLPLPPLGTMGAVITMRTDQASRNQLMDIGAAGPIAGFLVAMIAMAIGVQVSSTTIVEPSGPLTYFGDSLLSTLFLVTLRPEMTANEVLVAHPIWVGAWGGFLVTAINLLPMGQLDGGHILHAYAPKRSAYRAKRVFYLLIVLGLVGLSIHLPTILWTILEAVDLNPRRWLSVSYLNATTVFMPWLSHVFLIWAVFGRITGLVHPPLKDDQEVLTPARHWMAWICVAIFVLTFMPNPLWVEGVWRLSP